MEFTFNKVSSADEEAMIFDFAGLKNPDNGEVKIKLKCEWNEDIGDVDTVTSFIRDDVPEIEREIKVGTFSFRQYISCYHISAFRDLKKELYTQSGAMFELFKSFDPFFTIPSDSLKTKILQKSNEIIKVDENTKSYLNIIKDTIKSGTGDIFKELGNLDEYVESTPENKLLSKTNYELKSLIRAYHRKKDINQKISSLNNDLKKNSNLDSLESELVNLTSDIFVNDNIGLDFFYSEENEFLKHITINYGDQSILNNGDGYQNLINLFLRLLKSYYLSKNVINSSKFFILIIEEPESHLHPHLQKNIIKTLMKIQSDFRSEGIDFQLLISTHSPFIITPLSLDNLNFLRRKDDKIIANKIRKDEFIDELKAFGKISTIRRNLEMLFYNNSEIFFSKCVIVGEGDTEQGSLPIFAEKIGCSLEKHGISFLMGEGNNIFTYVRLLSFLNIPWVLLTDSDNLEEMKKHSLIPVEYEFDNKSPIFEHEDSCVCFTLEKAFEKEIISKSPYNKILNALELKSPEKLESWKDQIKNEFPHINKDEIVNLEDILEFLDLADTRVHKKFQNFLLKQMKGEKGILFGRILAELLNDDEIPETFIRSIKNAKKLSKLVG
jgi:predicted ATP-dependent endonuclease of OLD family